MEDNEFERKIEEYLKNNLKIEVTEVGSSYGSRPYALIELKLKDKVISESYINQ